MILNITNNNIDNLLQNRNLHSNSTSTKVSNFNDNNLNVKSVIDDEDQMLFYYNYVNNGNDSGYNLLLNFLIK